MFSIQFSYLFFLPRVFSWSLQQKLWKRTEAWHCKATEFPVDVGWIFTCFKVSSTERRNISKAGVNPKGGTQHRAIKSALLRAHFELPAGNVCERPRAERILQTSLGFKWRTSRWSVGLSHCSAESSHRWRWCAGGILAAHLKPFQGHSHWSKSS